MTSGNPGNPGNPGTSSAPGATRDPNASAPREGVAGKAVVLGMVAFAIVLTGIAMYFKQRGGLRYAATQFESHGVDLEAQLTRATRIAVAEFVTRDQLRSRYAAEESWSDFDLPRAERADPHALARGGSPWVIESAVRATGTRDRWTPWREDHEPKKYAEPDFTPRPVGLLTAIALLDGLRSAGLDWHLSISAFGVLRKGDGDARLDMAPYTLRFIEKQAWKMYFDHPQYPPLVYGTLDAKERSRRIELIDEARSLLTAPGVSEMTWPNYLPALTRQLAALEADAHAKQVLCELQVSPRYPWTIAVVSRQDGDFRWIQAPRKRP